MKTIKFKLLKLRKYNTFKDMYEDYTYLKILIVKDASMEEMVNGTYEIYTHNKKESGVR